MVALGLQLASQFIYTNLIQINNNLIAVVCTDFVPI